jgi:ABC-type multidrug transport system permease subunit
MNSWFRPEQMIHLIRAHFLELIREPGVLFWGIVFPILMSLGLGLAFTKKVETIREVALLVNTGNPKLTDDTVNGINIFLQTHKALPGITREGLHYSELTIKDDKLGDTRFQFIQMSWKDAMVQLKRGNIAVMISHEQGKPVYHFDPMNPDAQLIYIKLTGMFSGQIPLNRPSNEEIKPLTLEGTRYIDFLIPGLVAMGIMMACMWGISYGIIDNRGKKLLRRMVATPMRKSHYLLALITVRFAMNFIESGLLLLVAWLVFGITIQGNIGALITIFMAGNIAFAGIALLMSSHTAKTEIGNGLINAIVTPMMVLSGIFFSYHNFPEWSIPVIKALPLTMIADGIRSVFIEGAGFAEIMVPTLILTSIGVVCFSIGLRFFKWH